MKGKVDNYIPYIKQRLLLRYAVVDAMYSPNTDGAEELSFKYANKYDIVVVVGGDGTLHQVINGVMKSKANCLVAVLPFGTCNDVARTLNIPTKLDKAIDTVLRLNTTEYDLIYDGNEYIAYSLATGYLTKSTYAATNKAKKRFGRFAYFLSAIKCMFKFKALPITVKCDGERIHGKFVYFMLINGENAGGFKLNKGDDVHNGKVKMVIIKRSKFLGSFINFIKLFLFGINSIKKSKLAIVRDVKNVEIENHANAPFTVDGEKSKFLKKQVKIVTPIVMVKNN